MRIRSIKPEFWRSEDITALDWETRLLFIGLWSYVDDNGVGRDNERLILADLFALEEDTRETLATVSRGLQELFRSGLIVRYEVDGTPLLHIASWTKHQRIDKPNKARYEAPTCANAVIRDTLATPSRVSRESHAPGAVDQGTGEQGSREQGNEGAGFLSDKSDDTEPTRFDEFWETYSHKVGRAKAEKAYATALKKPGVTSDLLIASAAAYITWQMSEGKHPQYTKHPTSWLHGEHWRDERPARQAPQTNVQAHLALVQQLEAAEREQTLPMLGGAS